MKNSMTHFFDICNGKKDHDEGYNPMVMNNLLSNYEDTVLLASKLDTIPNMDSKFHYDLTQAFVPKGMRKTPTYIKNKLTNS